MGWRKRITSLPLWLRYGLWFLGFSVGYLFLLVLLLFSFFLISGYSGSLGEAGMLTGFAWIFAHLPFYLLGSALGIPEIWPMVLFGMFCYFVMGCLVGILAQLFRARIAKS